MRRISALAVLLAMSAFAADIGGKWKGSAEGPNGTIERTFTFKVNGATLAGETESEMLGKSVITDGKVDGDNISFTITANTQGTELKMAYKGKIMGDQIKLTVEFPGGGQTAEYTLKRI